MGNLRRGAQARQPYRWLRLEPPSQPVIVYKAANETGALVTKFRCDRMDLWLGSCDIASVRNIVKNLSTALATVFAIIGFLNIFELIEGLGKLSKSLHFLAAWWSYGVGTVFAVLGIHVSELSRTAIALLAVAQAAATIHSLAIHRMTPLVFVYRRMRERQAGDENPWEWKTGEELNNYQPRLFDIDEGAYLLAGIGLTVFLVVILYREVYLVKELIKISIPGIILLWALARSGFLWPLANSIENRLGIHTKITIGLLSLWCLPILIVMLIPINLIPFRRSIMWSAGVLLLMLFCNFLAVNYFDGILPILDHLPEPPTQLIR